VPPPQWAGASWSSFERDWGLSVPPVLLGIEQPHLGAPSMQADMFDPTSWLVAPWTLSSARKRRAGHDLRNPSGRGSSASCSLRKSQLLGAKHAMQCRCTRSGRSRGGALAARVRADPRFRSLSRSLVDAPLLSPRSDRQVRAMHRKSPFGELRARSTSARTSSRCEHEVDGVSSRCSRCASAPPSHDLDGRTARERERRTHLAVLRSPSSTGSG